MRYPFNMQLKALYVPSLAKPLRERNYPIPFLCVNAISIDVEKGKKALLPHTERFHISLPRGLNSWFHIPPCLYFHFPFVMLNRCYGIIRLWHPEAVHSTVEIDILNQCTFSTIQHNTFKLNFKLWAKVKNARWSLSWTVFSRVLHYIFILTVCAFRIPLICTAKSYKT